MGGSSGGTGGLDPTPLKIHKNIGLRSILFWIPRKITKLPSQHSMLDHYRHATETPFKWRFASGPMIARFKRCLDPLIN